MRFLARIMRFWLLLLFVLATAYFGVYNQEHVGLHLPPWIEHIQLPAYILFMTFFAAGAISMSLYFGVDHVKKSLELRSLRKRLRELGADEPEVRQDMATDSQGRRESLP